MQNNGEGTSRALKRIPLKVRKQIKINGLATAPHPLGSRLVHDAMDGERNIYRIRSGDYDVLYSIAEGTQIVVLDIDHRKDVYR